MSHSIQARQPSMIGEPLGDVYQSTPWNLSSDCRASAVQVSRCSCDSTLTQKRPARRMRGQLVDDLPAQKSTSGGSSESDMNDATAIPCGRPRTVAATTATPVGKCP